MRTDIVVLGVNGMLGNTLFKYLKNNTLFNVKGILRKKINLPTSFEYFNSEDLFECNVLEEENLKSLLKKLRPNYVINCIGIVKNIMRLITH